MPACLEALAREGVSALVVDNASSDETVRVAQQRGALVIRNLRNEGYGRANNIGVRATDAEFVLILNPDVVLDPGAVTVLLRAAELYPDAGLFAPRIVEPDGRFFFQARSLLSSPLKNQHAAPALPQGDCCTGFISGACFLMRRELFLRLGGFDQNIFLFYEDDDLSRRLADAGYALVHVQDAVARHGRGRSSARGPGRVFKGRWHQAWSRAYVSRKYGLPDPAARIFVVNAVRTFLALFTLRRSLIERYGGSAAGALTFLLGRTALAKENLAPPEEAR